VSGGDGEGEGEGEEEKEGGKPEAQGAAGDSDSGQQVVAAFTTTNLLGATAPPPGLREGCGIVGQ